MPFHAAIKVAMPMMKPMADNARQARSERLTVSKVADVKPARMPVTPRPRANTTRGRLPLQMDQRTKLGWAW